MLKICFLVIHIDKHLFMFHKTEFKVAKTWQRKAEMCRENTKCVPKSYRDDEHVIWFQILFFNRNSPPLQNKTPLKSPL